MFSIVRIQEYIHNSRYNRSERVDPNSESVLYPFSE